MFIGPAVSSHYAPKICQIPEIENIPDEISRILNGLEVWIFSAKIQIKASFCLKMRFLRNFYIKIVISQKHFRTIFSTY